MAKHTALSPAHITSMVISIFYVEIGKEALERASSLPRWQS